MFRYASVLAAAYSLMLPSQVRAQIAEVAKAQAADPLAPYVKASGWVSTGKAPVFVELIVDQDNAGLRLRRATSQRPEIRLLDTPSKVLKLLADQRMEFLSRALIEWGGPTLELMRDRQLARLRAAVSTGDPMLPSSTTGESTVRPDTRALLQLATFLTNVGQSVNAESLLQERLATMPVKAKRGRWSEIEWFTVAAMIATTREARNDVDGALAEYDLISAMLGSSPYAQNAAINRAALLVRKRRYADALAIIDPLWALWSKSTQVNKVSGSERQFAWIRACALEGLGRHAEADVAFQPVLWADHTHDPDFVIESDNEVKLRGLVCMRRTAEVKAMVSNDIENGLSSHALLIFQPGYRPHRDAEFWAEIRSDPGLEMQVRTRMRILPPDMVPALNDWR